MTVVALCSFKGAPGVTTTALGLTSVWQRNVALVEADPSGGSICAHDELRGELATAFAVVFLIDPPLRPPRSHPKSRGDRLPQQTALQEQLVHPVSLDLAAFDDVPARRSVGA